MKKHPLVFMLVIFALGSMTTQRAITGTSTDHEGKALIGANLLVKCTTAGTVTDFDGKYLLNVPDNATALVVNYTAYVRQELEIEASAVLDVILAEGIFLPEAIRAVFTNYPKIES